MSHQSGYFCCEERIKFACTVRVQVTYTTLLDGYVKAGDLDAAQLLWLDMRQSNVLPNAATFNTLLTGLAASPDPESLKVCFNILLAEMSFCLLLLAKSFS